KDTRCARARSYRNTDGHPNQARKRDKNDNACQRGQAEKDCLAHFNQRNACEDEPPDLPKRECCHGHDKRGPPAIRPTRALLRSSLRELVACAERRSLKRALPSTTKNQLPDIDIIMFQMS